MAILGHIDHGKTTLLSSIKNLDLNRREKGGITQAIGAYQIEFKDQKITFIDTPGHEAFAKMRSRGTRVADLAVLVVAADDGVMPQTLESMKYINNAQIPFLVAINKIDLANVDPEKVKTQLAENGILVEGKGGKVVAVPISAKTGQGVDDLLEMILLIAELEEIKADPEGVLDGVVIEAKKGKAGSVGTLIIKNGTLRVGDQILIDEVSCKVKGLVDEQGKRVDKAQPGEPVEVLGFDSPPPVGARVTKTSLPSKKPLPFQAASAPSLPEEGKLKIILKADTAGSLEALKENLTDDVFLVSEGVGNVFDSDILLAQTTKAKIFCFKVKAPSSVAQLAKSEKVEIKTYEIIYQFLDAIEEEVLKVIQEESAEIILGKAVIIAEFLIEGTRVAGCRVIEGRINQNDQIILKRGEQSLGPVKITSMRRKHQPITEAKLKEEFGVLLDSPVDFKVGDVLASLMPKENE